MIKATNPPKTEKQAIHAHISEGEALNRILRGEISAAEAYVQVLKMSPNFPKNVRLDQFYNHHKDMVSFWTDQVANAKMIPEDDSGSWGSIVQAFVGTAKLFGEGGALRALKTGEEHGLEEYKTFLENKYVSEKHKRYVRETVIPALELHINSIEALSQLD